MKKAVQSNMIAHLLELMLMPAILYTYRDNGVLYWMVLILVDDAILKHQDIKGLYALYQNGGYKTEVRTLFVLECFMMLGLVIIACKNWHVALILLINDLILDFVGIFGSYNEHTR